MLSDALQGLTVLRFAPSPNGRLHLGHAYSALFNERVAWLANGRLLLRIEDLDRSRCKPQYEAAIVDDLAWLGLRFEAPTRRQSEHAADYAVALDGLAARGLAYPCFCTRAEVARASKALDPDGAPLYSGACRALLPSDVAARIDRGRKPAWRLNSLRAIESAPRGLVWTEFGEGSTPVDEVVKPERWGDVVLCGRDLAASYHLAVTVDDALQRITDVVRGRDLLAATSVHRLLQEVIGLSSPCYRHHRLVLDPEGAKLSKRRQSPTLADLRARGVSPSEIRAALGFGHSEGLAVTLS